MPGPRIPSTVKDHVAEMIRNGSSVNSAAIECGVSHSTAWRVAWKLGLREAKPVKPLTPEEKRRIQSLYETGASARAVARETEIGVDRVLTVLHEQGIERRRYQRSTACQRKRMVDLYMGGASAAEAAESQGFTEIVALSALNNAGLESRTSGKRLHTLDRFIFDTIDTEEKAYWLGFLGADGHVSQERGSVCLSLATCDHEHVDSFRLFLGSSHRIEADDRRSRLQISSVELAASLYTHGLRDGKSASYEPWTGPPHLMRHYWRGMIDGDGSLFTPSGKQEDTLFMSLVGTQACMDGYSRFVADCIGYVPSVNPHKMIWQCTLSWHATKAMCEILYRDCTIALPRKIALAKQAMARDTAYRWKYKVETNAFFQRPNSP